MAPRTLGTAQDLFAAYPRKKDFKVKKPEQDIRTVRFPGLMRDARRLGVHRNHLYLVLTGNRPSPSLLERYKKLHKERT